MAYDQHEIHSESTNQKEKRAKEPDMAEFVSALAAGNNAQLMVIACATAASSTTLALVAAAHQTGGRVICILPSTEQVSLSRKTLGVESRHVEFVIGEVQSLLANDYKKADFVLIDFNLENYKRIFKAVQAGERKKNTIILGYNAFCKDSWSWGGSETQLLPIGEGLLVTRIAAKPKLGLTKRSHWIVKVDKCTGEEHVFRVRSPQTRVIEA